ncbi:MAG: glycosyltransferase family 2 protein [Bacteroidota bacterium]
MRSFQRGTHFLYAMLRLSIVTACLNAEKYIDRTLQSILGQGYPKLEYIIKDGGSTDRTLEKIRPFQSQIHSFQSKSDEGQYAAIQEGLMESTGEIMGWINADDQYFPGSFSVVNQIFSQFPEVNWIVGVPAFLNAQGHITKVSTNSASAFYQPYIQQGVYRDYLAGYLQQESMFWRRSLWDKVGGLDLQWKLAADFDLWTRFAAHAELVQVVSPLAAFREMPGAQRSSLFRKEYEQEVSEIVSNKSKPAYLWNAIARKGVIWRSLCRLAIWKPTKTIAFNTEREAWELLTHKRPISRATFLDMLLEKKIRG